MSVNAGFVSYFQFVRDWGTVAKNQEGCARPTHAKDARLDPVAIRLPLRRWATRQVQDRLPQQRFGINREGWTGGRIPAWARPPEPVVRLRTQQERDYLTPQILPLNSPFHRPLTPNGLLGSVQRMNGPAISSCPEADANLLVPFTIFAVAL